jgi:hypothetical protein
MEGENQPQPDQPIVERSDPQMIIDAVQATGVAAGGLGTLAIGVGKLKQAFGSDGPQTEQPAKSPPAQSDD